MGVDVGCRRARKCGGQRRARGRSGGGLGCAFRARAAPGPATPRTPAASSDVADLVARRDPQILSSDCRSFARRVPPREGLVDVLQLGAPGELQRRALPRSSSPARETTSSTDRPTPAGHPPATTTARPPVSPSNPRSIPVGPSLTQRVRCVGSLLLPAVGRSKEGRRGWSNAPSREVHARPTRSISRARRSPRPALAASPHDSLSEADPRSLFCPSAPSSTIRPRRASSLALQHDRRPDRSAPVPLLPSPPSRQPSSPPTSISSCRPGRSIDEDKLDP